MRPHPPWDEMLVHLGSELDVSAPLSTLSEHGLADDYHCLYVLTFDNELTKVGRTTSPRRRLKEHVVEARRWGVSFAAAWMSAPFAGDAAAREHRLIEACRAATGQASAWRKEYFPGLPFDAAHELARAIVPGVDTKALIGIRSVRGPAAAESAWSEDEETERQARLRAAGRDEAGRFMTSFSLATGAAAAG